MAKKNTELEETLRREDSAMDLINKYKPNKKKILANIKWWRPTKYKPSYVSKMLDFFIDHGRHRTIIEETVSVKQVVEFRKRTCWVFPMFSRFAHWIGVTEKTMLNRTEKHEEFLQAYNTCRAIQKEFLAQWTLNWIIASNTWKFFLNANHGMVEELKQRKIDDTWDAMKWKMDNMKDDIKSLSDSVNDLDAGELQDKLNSIIQTQG